jgi:dTMP kinase
MSEQGRYITLEGIGGCGKTTQMPMLVAWLRAKGKSVVEAKEPGLSEVGRTIRKMVLENTDLDPLTEAFLFEADRSNTFRTVVFPALQNGDWVVSDRGPFGTEVFQGILGSVDRELISRMTLAATRGRLPDLAFWLDIPAELAAQRLAARNDSRDKFDERGLEYLRKMRDAYVQLREEYPHHVVRIAADVRLEDVRSQIRSHLSQFM